MSFSAPYPGGDPVPVQDDVTTALRGGYPTKIAHVPRELSAEAYREYREQYGTGQSHERLLERAGFGLYELTVLLFQRIKRLEHESAHLARTYGFCRTCGRSTQTLTPDAECKDCARYR